MKRLFSFVILLFVFCAYAQVSKKTTSLIKPLEKLEYFLRFDDENIKNIEKQLYEEASPKELYFLAEKGSNSYIKAIAINVLAERGDRKLLEIFQKNIASKEKIVYRTSCLSSDFLVTGHIFDAISSSKSKFSEEEKETFKQQMLFDVLDHKPINRELLETISGDVSKSEEVYSRLRKQVISLKSPELLNIIAEYKKPQDIELIKSFGKGAFPAIDTFPDPKFLPFMKKNVMHSKDFYFMFALSNFCSEEAKEIVIKAIENNKKENLKNEDCGSGCLSTIYQLISMKKCTLYSPLLADLWLTDKIISLDILEDYEKTHTKKEVEKFLLEGFLRPGEAEVIAFNQYNAEEGMDNLLSGLEFDFGLRLVKLLEKTKKISDVVYEKAVRNSLETIDGVNLDSFISDLKDNQAILNNKDVLVERMKTNKKINDLRFMLTGIEALNDNEFYNTCITTIAQRKSEFLGEKAKEYMEFLENHKLK